MKLGIKYKILKHSPILILIILFNTMSCVSKEIVLSVSSPSDLVVSQSQPPVQFEKYLGDVSIEKSSFNGKEARESATKDLYEESKKLGGNYIYIFKMETSSHNFGEGNDFKEALKTKVRITAKVYKL